MRGVRLKRVCFKKTNLLNCAQIKENNYLIDIWFFIWCGVGKFLPFYLLMGRSIFSFELNLLSFSYFISAG